jgi:hypothetical protein
LRIGFLGGSITDQRTGKRWSEDVVAWFSRRFSGVRLIVENAAISATGSNLAVFRAARDIIDRRCDLVFVEYAVNDNHEPPLRYRRSREGLLRQLLAEPRDVVLVYTHRKEFYPDMLAGRVPPSIADFEALGAHYRLSSVWAGLHALREVEAGLLRWEEWLPDGLHPEARGSLAYAESVVAVLRSGLVDPCVGSVVSAAPAGDALPAPLDPLCWEKVSLIPFASITRSGPWTERRHESSGWIDQVLFCTAPGATLSARFDGRGLVAGFDFGKNSGEFRWRIDGGEWRVSERARDWWVGDSGWFRPSVLAEDLEPGSHVLEFETRRGVRDECKGCTTALAFLGVIQ